MADLYKNTYRIASARLQTWDYASEGLYFVTICTKDRECHFGDVVDNEMQLSEIGGIAQDEWYKTPGLRPDMNLELGEFQVMPNHIHGIVIIGVNEFNRDDQRRRDPMHCRDAMHCVSTTEDANINDDDPTPKNQFGPQRKNLSSVIRGYKSAVTTYARKNNIPFDWQSRFHDHIIRSPDDYYRISNYIINNPLHWNQDKFYKQ